MIQTPLLHPEKLGDGKEKTVLLLNCCSKKHVENKHKIKVAVTGRWKGEEGEMERGMGTGPEKGAGRRSGGRGGGEEKKAKNIWTVLESDSRGWRATLKPKENLGGRLNSRRLKLLWWLRLCRIFECTGFSRLEKNWAHHVRHTSGNDINQGLRWTCLVFLPVPERFQV